MVSSTAEYFALKNLEDPEMDENLAERTFQQFPTPEGNETRVIVHQDSDIAPGVQFGELAGPVGHNTRVSEGSLILGAIYGQVKLERGVTVGKKARLGTIVEAEYLGAILVGELAQIGATARIFSPENECTTIVGARSIIGEGSVIGLKSKPLKLGSATRVTQGREVVVEDDVEIAPQTIILPGVYIGSGSTIGTGYKLAKGLELPSNTHIQDNPSFSKLHPSKLRLVTPEWLKKNPSLVTFN
jgi:UDP-3-O-[3-hydroxymyristoyl] glucosamine N-acyltransferase